MFLKDSTIKFEESCLGNPAASCTQVQTSERTLAESVSTCTFIWRVREVWIFHFLTLYSVAKRDLTLCRNDVTEVQSASSSKNSYAAGLCCTTSLPCTAALPRDTIRATSSRTQARNLHFGGKRHLWEKTK
eukprot:78742-Amphidinium_carterae.1